jgi:hypothetical protein
MTIRYSKMWHAGAGGTVIDTATNEVTLLAKREYTAVYNTDKLYSWRGSSGDVEYIDRTMGMPSSGWAVLPWIKLQ